MIDVKPDRLNVGGNDGIADILDVELDRDCLTSHRILGHDLELGSNRVQAQKSTFHKTLWQPQGKPAPTSSFS